MNFLKRRRRCLSARVCRDGVELEEGLVAAVCKLGLRDQQQIRVAKANRAVIFTHDVDFLRMVRHRHHLGIIYVHQQKLTIGECIRRLKVMAETKSPAEVHGRIIFLLIERLNCDAFASQFPEQVQYHVVVVFT